LIGRIDDAEVETEDALFCHDSSRISSDENNPGLKSTWAVYCWTRWGHALEALQLLDINKLKTGTWQPQLYLTPEENMIVKKKAPYCFSVDGTGRQSSATVFSDDRQCEAEGDPNFKQLFVARSVGLCKCQKELSAVNLVEKVAGMIKKKPPIHLDKLLKTCEDN
jgi:hypothetical protein